MVRPPAAILHTPYGRIKYMEYIVLDPEVKQVGDISQPGMVSVSLAWTRPSSGIASQLMTNVDIRLHSFFTLYCRFPRRRFL